MYIKNQTHCGKKKNWKSTSCHTVTFKYAGFLKVYYEEVIFFYINTLRYVHFFHSIPYLVLLTKYQPFVGGVKSFENKI